MKKILHSSFSKKNLFRFFRKNVPTRKIFLEEETDYEICTCQESRSYPFCEDKHNENTKPFLLHNEKPREVYILKCGDSFMITNTKRCGSCNVISVVLLSLIALYYRKSIHKYYLRIKKRVEEKKLKIEN